MPAGRPTKYKPELCGLLVEHMKGGLSFESFAGVAECTKETLYQWVKEKPEFADAKRHGEGLSQMWWERVGRAGMLGLKGPDGKPIRTFNATIWIFNMKNRFGWRDKQELSGSLAIEPFVVESPNGESTTIGGKQK